MYKSQLPRELQDLSGEKLKIALIELRKKEIVKLVCRQTNYTEEEAAKRLEENKYNYMTVIKSYINPEVKEKKEIPKKVSLNQQIIGQIRNFMDQGAKLSEQRRKRAIYMENLKRVQQAKAGENTKLTGENTKLTGENTKLKTSD